MLYIRDECQINSVEPGIETTSVATTVGRGYRDRRGEDDSGAWTEVVGRCSRLDGSCTDDEECEGEKGEKASPILHA
jgi:hypothetical protein